jgi:hypothetical protein
MDVGKGERIHLRAKWLARVTQERALPKECDSLYYPVVSNEVSSEWVLNGNSDVRTESAFDLSCFPICMNVLRRGRGFKTSLSTDRSSVQSSILGKWISVPEILMERI